MNKNARIYVAGHLGMVGSAIVRKLKHEGYTRILVRTFSELDLRNQAEVKAFFDAEKPEYVFHAAAKVGGIVANNTYRADFIYDNIMIATNVIHAAHQSDVTKLMFLGSSCIYPKMAPQPLKEDYLLTGLLEPTNEPYAIAKITGIKLCEAYHDQYNRNFMSVMPTNLYGPNDNYHPENSHVLPALLRRFHEAKMQDQPEVVCWGSGAPMREFLHVDDLADACVFLMKEYNGKGFLNIGTGKDLTIKDLAGMVAKIVGYKGEIRWDTDRPDGTPKKQLDVGRLNRLGWQHQIELEEGIRSVYKEIVDLEIF